MKLIAYNNEQAFEELKPEWNALLERSAYNSIFSTWEWQSNWWAAYEPGELWIITARTDDDRLVGLATWFIETNDAGERIVRGVGCVDVTDYVDIVIDAGCTEPVYNFLAEFLAENREKYDRINLCNLPEPSPTHQRFPGFLEKFGFETAVELQEVCPVIELPDEWNDYLSSLSKKHRHELRRKMRRAHGQGSVDWYIVDETHDIDEQLNLFLKLMADSDPEKAEFLEDKNNLDFFHKVMPVMFECGWLSLNFLTVDGNPAAAYLNFDYHGRILVYNSGLSQDYGAISPGIVLLGHNIRYAIENGYQHFDFLRGNEEYKYHMGGKDTPVYMLQATINQPA